MAGRLQLKDKFGNDLYFGHAGDIWLPQFPGLPDYRQHLHFIRHMELRPDDVILTGYPKAGFHWNQEIVHMLLHGAAEYVGSQGFGEFLEGYPPDRLVPPTKPRVFFTHLRFQHLPIQTWAKKVKVLYLTRNPKDSWVSLYNHWKYFKFCPGYEGTWDQFFEVMMDMGLWYGDYFDYMLDWEKHLDANTHLPVMTSNFEDLKNDPVGQIEKIDKFLGLNRGRELCEKIAQACDFSVLKTAKDGQMPDEVKKMMWKEGALGFFRK
ncbi:hypothetical protein BaRGS_00036456, partial [Batillaria attramentaria]